MSLTKSTRVMVLALLMATPVWLSAHMKLEKSLPADGATLTAPPSVVELSFNEAPDMAVSKLEIHGPGTNAKLVGTHAMGNMLMATVQGDLPDGAYAILWQGAGDDGHAQKGEVKFTLKRK